MLIQPKLEAKAKPLRKVSVTPSPAALLGRKWTHPVFAPWTWRSAALMLDWPKDDLITTPLVARNTKRSRKFVSKGLGTEPPKGAYKRGRAAERSFPERGRGGLHSCLSASMGSREAARRAGMKPKRMPMAAEKTKAMRLIFGSNRNGAPTTLASVEQRP